MLRAFFNLKNAQLTICDKQKQEKYVQTYLKKSMTHVML